MIMENCKTHQNLDAHEYAKKHDIVVGFLLPPHTTHLLQPADIGVSGPLKGLVL